MGGGFKEDDAVWKEPQQPKNEQLPELKVGGFLLVVIFLKFYTCMYTAVRKELTQPKNGQLPELKIRCFLLFVMFLLFCSKG